MNSLVREVVKGGVTIALGLVLAGFISAKFPAKA